MKEYYKNIQPFLSIVAIIFAVIAICRTYPSNTGIDYQGIIVGILALLVTVLIGWQIYTTINIKEELKEIDKFKNEVVSNIEKKSAKIEYEMALELSKVIQMLTAVWTNDISKYLPVLFSVYYSSRNSESIVTKKAASLFIYNSIIALLSIESKSRTLIINEFISKLKYEEVRYFLLENFSQPSSHELSDERRQIFDWTLDLLKEISKPSGQEHQM